MRFLTPTLVFTTVLAASTAMPAQQPEVVHAQLSTQAADHGLGAGLDGLKRQNTPLWAGYTIPVADKFSSGWRTTHVAYLEGEHESNGDDSEITTHPFDHAEILQDLEGRLAAPLELGGHFFVLQIVDQAPFLDQRQQRTGNLFLHIKSLAP